MIVVAVLMFLVIMIKNIIKDNKKGKKNGENNSTK